MTDINKYNEEMKKSLIDKIYFIDKIETKFFVDYGCADGTMLKFLAEMFPESVFLGYDNNLEMIELAELDNHFENLTFTNDINKVINLAGLNDVALILSSVLHEIYHAHKEDELWYHDIKAIQPKYIVIRDMAVSRTTSRTSDNISVAKVWMNHDQQQLKEWEEQWGSLNENWSLVHFLLKYRFQDNWDTEVKENYLSYNVEKLLADVPKGYEPIFMEHYTLPFVRNEVKKTFGIDLQDKTHIKLILKRK